MLTLKSVRVLAMLARSQSRKGMRIFVHYENHCFYQVADAAEVRADVPCVKFSFSKEEMLSILEYLQGKGFIKVLDSSYEHLILTHPGAEFFSILLLQFLRFLVFSVAVPVFVAWLTALSVSL